LAAQAGWRNVVAVRITLLSRNLEGTPGWQDGRSYPLGLQGLAPYALPAFADNIKRRAATTTVRLQSVAGLREAP
jgi:type IV pilus assembly protein PilW